MIYKSKNIPWKIKCWRLVDHVFAVLSFGSENWTWTIKTIERIKEWETKTMLCLPLQMRKRRNVCREVYKELQNGPNNMGTDGFALSVRGYVASHGMGI